MIALLHPNCQVGRKNKVYLYVANSQHFKIFKHTLAKVVSLLPVNPEQIFVLITKINVKYTASFKNL